VCIYSLSWMNLVFNFWWIWCFIFDEFAQQCVPVLVLLDEFDVLCLMNLTWCHACVHLLVIFDEFDVLFLMNLMFYFWWIWCYVMLYLMLCLMKLMVYFWCSVWWIWCFWLYVVCVCIYSLCLMNLQFYFGWIWCFMFDIFDVFYLWWIWWFMFDEFDLMSCCIWCIWCDIWWIWCFIFDALFDEFDVFDVMSCMCAFTRYVRWICCFMFDEFAVMSCCIWCYNITSNTSNMYLDVWFLMYLMRYHFVHCIDLSFTFINVRPWSHVLSTHMMQIEHVLCMMLCHVLYHSDRLCEGGGTCSSIHMMPHITFMYISHWSICDTNPSTTVSTENAASPRMPQVAGHFLQKSH